LRPPLGRQNSLVGSRVHLDLDAIGADGPALGELELQPVDAVREQALADTLELIEFGSRGAPPPFTRRGGQLPDELS
jgi:hypothetical protein